MSEALLPWGWDEAWARIWAEHGPEETLPGRVLAEHKGGLKVLTEQGEHLAVLSGKLKQAAKRGLTPGPAVGDWVALGASGNDGFARIQGVLPRRTCLSRRAAGEATQQQVVAANVDTAFLVTSLATPLNARRLERTLTIAREGGAAVVVLLTQADRLAGPEAEAARVQAQAVAAGAEVRLTSALTGEGVEALAPLLAVRRTAVLLGASGAGKSTLLNRLLGEERQATKEVDEEGKGRHATTHRELFALPGGALVVDTPGVRELGLWLEAGEIDASFPEIEALAPGCRFSDCAHRTEPGCAVREGVPAERLAAFHKLKDEAAALAARYDARSRHERKREDKAATKAAEQLWRRR